MFKIKAVEDKREQEQVCSICGVEYLHETLAFAAYDIDDSDGDISGVIAVCQFSISGGNAEIHGLDSAPGRSEDEAVIILGFTVLDFFRRCGFEYAKANLSDRYAGVLGLKKTADCFIVDLTKKRGCGGNHG